MPDSPAPAVLEVSDVRKAFPRRRAAAGGAEEVVALEDVSLAIAPGEILAVVGESGAGKSTLARVILGLERPDAGRVTFEGRDLAALSRRALRRARRRMHLVLQDPYESLHPGMRVLAAVGEPLAIAGMAREPRAARATAALEEVGLTPAPVYATRFPHELSGGQRQRVAIARALAGEPRLVIADEPTSMVDASLRAGILGLIRGMRRRHGTAFVVITHDLAVARHVSDRVVVMQAGRIVEIGATARVVAAPQHEHTRALLAASEGPLEKEQP